jgi:hypothetical protein
VYFYGLGFDLPKVDGVRFGFRLSGFALTAGLSKKGFPSDNF